MGDLSMISQSSQSGWHGATSRQSVSAGRGHRGSTKSRTTSAPKVIRRRPDREYFPHRCPMATQPSSLDYAPPARSSSEGPIYPTSPFAWSTRAPLVTSLTMAAPLLDPQKTMREYFLFSSEATPQPASPIPNSTVRTSCAVRSRDCVSASCGNYSPCSHPTWQTLSTLDRKRCVTSALSFRVSKSRVGTRWSRPNCYPNSERGFAGVLPPSLRIA